MENIYKEIKNKTGLPYKIICEAVNLFQGDSEKVLEYLSLVTDGVFRGKKIKNKIIPWTKQDYIDYVNSKE